MGKSLLEVLTEVAVDADKQAAYADDPARYLAEYGYEGVDADALDEAFSLVADTLPPDVAQSVTPRTATAPLDQDDGSGGAPDATINPDEDAFGGVDESFDTAALNGVADDGTGDPDAGESDVTDGNGGYGTGELSLGDLADDGLDAGDTVAFGVGSEGAEGGDLADTALADDLAGDDGTPFLEGDTEAFALDDVVDIGDAGEADDGFDDAPDLGGAPVDEVDDGPPDDLSFDDVGSF